jgi:hypothetical protein
VRLASDRLIFTLTAAYEVTRYANSLIASGERSVVSMPISPAWGIRRRTFTRVERTYAKA